MTERDQILSRLSPAEVAIFIRCGGNPRDIERAKRLAGVRAIAELRLKAERRRDAAIAAAHQVYAEELRAIERGTTKLPCEVPTVPCGTGNLAERAA
nr:hypothetical protein [uncultured Rhodopila sp.]